MLLQFEVVTLQLLPLLLHSRETLFVPFQSVFLSFGLLCEYGPYYNVIHVFCRVDTFGFFKRPVSKKEVPGYHDIIENPMDFATMRRKIQTKQYKEWVSFWVRTSIHLPPTSPARYRISVLCAQGDSGSP